MKKLILLSLILAAGLTAYPQSSRSSREAKSSKSKSSQVSSRSSSNKGSSSKAVSSRSTSSQKKTSAVKSGNSSSRSGNAVRSGNSSSSRSSRSGNAIKSGNSSSRSTSAVRSGNSSSRTSSAVKSGNSGTRTSRSAVGNPSSSRSGQSGSSTQRSSRSSVKSDNSKLNQSKSSRSAVPTKVKTSERSRSQESAVKSRSNDGNNSASRNSSSSFNRSNRQGSKAYLSHDGREYKHQNDEVFTRSRYRTDYSDINSLRRSNDFIRVHNNYNNWYSHRHARKVVVHNHYYRPLALDIRMVRYPYRRPVHLDLCWTPHLHHSFVYYYPLHNNWNNISYGDYIETASSYEAMNYVGTVKRVYGKVEEVYYSPEDKTYTLYFGAPYPYHDFSVVVPRNVAKSFSWSPSWYFEDEHVWAVGLIEMWEGKPEIVLHDEQQIRRY